MLAGSFFQASLLPYLFFLYFLAFSANRISTIGNFGFQYLLLFVAATIVAGIVTKSVYSLSLADCDWMHGMSESVLTVSNLLIVFGFNEAMTNRNAPSNMACYVAILFAAICFTFVALGTTTMNLGQHSQLLGGLGNLSPPLVKRLPWVRHVEPDNALSIPTWMVHFSSVFEYLFAMNLIWRYAHSTGNERWKLLTWAMVPLHASSICAVTHHFFYNAPELLFLVTLQAFLTLLGNITCMVAAFCIARSNGWKYEKVLGPCCCERGSHSVQDTKSQQSPLHLTHGDSSSRLALKLFLLVLIASYLVKYGEMGLDLPFHPTATAALILIVAIPLLTVVQYSILSIVIVGGGGTTHAEARKESIDAEVLDEEMPLISAINPKIV